MTEVIINPTATSVVVISNPSNSSSNISANTTAEVTVVSPTSTTTTNTSVSVNPAANSTITVLAEKQGPKGDSGGSYIHVQNTSSNVWTINQSLGYYPSVSALDSAGTQVEGDITWTSANSLTVTFSAAFGGVAYLS